MVKVASGGVRRVGNRVRKRKKRKASRKERMVAGRNFPEAARVLEVLVRRPACVGSARVLTAWVKRLSDCGGREGGRGEALEQHPVAQAGFPAAPSACSPTSSFRKKRCCSSIRIIYKIMVHCLH